MNFDKESSLPHVIVCGLGGIGWPVLDYLRASGWSIVAIDQNCRPDDPRLEGIRLIRGDYREASILREAGVESAQGVLLLANDDLVNLATSLEVRRLNNSVRIVVRLFNENLLSKLDQTINNVVPLSASRLAAPLLASTALSGDLLASFQSQSRSWQIVALSLAPDSTLVGKKWHEVKQTIPRVYPLSRNGMEQDLKLRSETPLIVAGSPDDLAKLREVAQGEEAFVVRWAGQVRRFLRTIWRTFWEIEWPVRIAALSLFTVILFGSLVCWLSGLADTLPRGLLRTLNIMVTSADLKEQDYPAPWQHVFISFLKLAGLLLTAAFTALMTNYLVRARLGGALAIRKIPESGHIVLCGLGTVGIRVVEHLRGHGAAVVVMEKAEGTRFLAGARQRGATVLLGDATLLSNLERARTGTAQAFIAATSSDLANVEMALLARELNPKLRVVVRLEDSALADSLRKTANIRYALGLPQLIAPAFVAPLFGDLVLCLFWLNNTLHAVLQMKVDLMQTQLLGKKVEELEKELTGTFIPLSSQEHPECVGVGQQYLVVVPVSCLARFLEVSKQEVMNG